MVIARNGLAACLLAGTLALATTAYAQGITDMKKGEGGSAVQGSDRKSTRLNSSH